MIFNLAVEGVSSFFTADPVRVESDEGVGRAAEPQTNEEFKPPPIGVVPHLGVLCKAAEANTQGEKKRFDPLPTFPTVDAARFDRNGDFKIGK